jgi:4-amino-4-deoxy-L-arabinose transferase-like glycosyltransferase
MATTTYPPQSIGRALLWPAQPQRDTDRSSYLLISIVIVTILTGVRLVGLRFSVADLFYDEAQYWSWSRELAPGYYTKPPLLAWVIAGATHVCGNAEWCIRAPSPFFYAGTSLLAYAIGRDLYDERTGFWAMLATALGTGVVFSSRIISTDVPLLFFWTLALWAYVRLLAHPNRRWAVLLGLALGLGMLSKYAMIYFVPGIALAAVLGKHARLALMRREMWFAAAVAALVVAPNVAWNASNGFATVEHTGDIVLGDPVHPSIMRLLEFVGSQVGVFGPVVFAVMTTALFRLAGRRLLEQDRILVAFFVPALLVVAGFAFGVKANGNWAAVSFVSGAILTAALLARDQARGWMGLGIAIGLVFQITILVTDAFANRLPLGPIANPYRRTIGWREYAEAVGTVARRSGAKTIVTDARSEFAALEYYWRDQPEKVLWWRRIEVPEFAMDQALTQSSTEPILFVTGCASLDKVHQTYSQVDLVGAFAAPVSKLPRDGERSFHAFRLGHPRGPVPPFTSC